MKILLLLILFSSSKCFALEFFTGSEIKKEKVRSLFSEYKYVSSESSLMPLVGENNYEYSFVRIFFHPASKKYFYLKENREGVLVSFYIGETNAKLVPSKNISDWNNGGFSVTPLQVSVLEAPDARK